MSSIIAEKSCKTLIYVFAGDASDADGYIVAALLNKLVKILDNDKETNVKIAVAIVVPERQAISPGISGDALAAIPAQLDSLTHKHDDEVGDKAVKFASRLFRGVAESATLYRGPRNERNVIPWKFMVNEERLYGPALPATDESIREIPLELRELSELRDYILSDDVDMVCLDVNGAVGYMHELRKMMTPNQWDTFGRKVKASGVPIVWMAGVLSEVTPATQSLPGRDRRSTMNAIYHPSGVRALLDLAREFELPMVFATNNVCNSCYKFDSAADVLSGFMPPECEGKVLWNMMLRWYEQPHLKGKCVPFDVVAFIAFLVAFVKANPTLVLPEELAQSLAPFGGVSSGIEFESRELYVGTSQEVAQGADASVLVLHKLGADDPLSMLADTEKFSGVVDVVSYISAEKTNKVLFTMFNA